MRFGFKISGCFGDVLYSTPVLKYLSKCHGDKLDIETKYLFENLKITKKHPILAVKRKDIKCKRDSRSVCKLGKCTRCYTGHCYFSKKGKKYFSKK